jgi:nickel-dependent lactate racemase
MMLKKADAGGTLSRDDVGAFVAGALSELPIDGKRLLIIIPDGTRTMPMPQLFELLQRNLETRVAVVDYLVALGTHPLMNDAQLTRLVGREVVDGVCGKSRIFNHRSDIASTFAEIGTIPAAEVEKISGGILKDAIAVRINRMIFEYDQILICGPVFPHEVAGFSGGNKYLFPGVSGRDMIDQTHWLGALLGSRNIIGTPHTAVREMIDRAAEHVSVPVACFALVLTVDGIRGMFFGSAREAWQGAASLSSECHIEWADRPYRRILSVMPPMYEDMWTAAKGMYKAEPAIEDGGEVIIYAPNVTHFSYTHGATIEKIGYHCRDYFLKQWGRFSNVPRGILAHSIHVRGEGTFDEVSGKETSWIRVTLATGISEEQCRRVNLGYVNPHEIKVSEWEGREAEGIKVVPRAGEILQRVRTARKS